MNTQTKIEAPPDGLALLRAPFPEHQISKLPKETRAQIDARKSDKNVMVWKCEVCGGAHHKNAVHLDYVGHAALTDRLLDTDIEWSWEPLAFNDEGLPAFDRNGGLWIKLTVRGVSRLGYGHAGDKSGGDAIKEVIGDALRNAAMRFGAALDLWHKGDLHAEETAEGHSLESAVSPRQPTASEVRTVEPTTYEFPDGPATGITQLKALARALWREVEGCGDEDELLCLIEAVENKAVIDQLSRLENPEHRKIWEGDGGDNPGLHGHIQRKQAHFKAELLRA